jgi:hypothetical protein
LWRLERHLHFSWQQFLFWAACFFVIKPTTSKQKRYLKANHGLQIKSSGTRPLPSLSRHLNDLSDICVYLKSICISNSIVFICRNINNNKKHRKEITINLESQEITFARGHFSRFIDFIKAKMYRIFFLLHRSEITLWPLESLGEVSPTSVCGNFCSF